MNTRTLATAAAVSMASAMAFGQDIHDRLYEKSYYFNIYGGQSMTILGSEDRRTGFGIGFGYGRREPRFAIKGVGSQLVYEVYYEHSSSRGASGQGPNQSESFGVLAYARHRWPQRRGMGLYATVGWGLQYTNRTSVDLDSNLNSTPMLGLGVSWENGFGEGSIGLRFVHISNAGLVGRNQGQNQLSLVYSLRF
jgi:hypothetical protein